MFKFLNLNHRVITSAIFNNSEISFIKGLVYYNPSPTIIKNNLSVFYFYQWVRKFDISYALKKERTSSTMSRFDKISRRQTVRNAPQSHILIWARESCHPDQLFVLVFKTILGNFIV